MRFPPLGFTLDADFVAVVHNVENLLKIIAAVNIDMAINPTISNVSLPQLESTDLSALDNRGLDGAISAPSEAVSNGGLAGDELMSMNVWGAGSKMLVDQRALNSQAMSAQDIVGLLIIRG
jgi:hypothetical protein